MITVYVSIGNSDDKLSQADWFEFVTQVAEEIRKRAAETHGAWHSSPVSPYQNACWCVELSPEMAGQLKRQLAQLAGWYRQDSIAWAEAPTAELIGPAS